MLMVFYFAGCACDIFMSIDVLFVYSIGGLGGFIAHGAIYKLNHRFAFEAPQNFCLLLVTKVGRRKPKLVKAIVIFRKLRCETRAMPLNALPS